MKDPGDGILTWIYTTLNGKVSYDSSTVPYYTFPPKDQSFPYILMGGMSSVSELEESTKDAWITRQSFSLEIYAASKGKVYSYKPVNTIANSVIQLIRTRTEPTISGYNVVSVQYDGGITDKIMMDNQIVMIKIMNFTLIMEES